MYPAVINVFNQIPFVFFMYLVDGRGFVRRNPKNDYCSKKGTMCIVVYWNKVLKTFTVKVMGTATVLDKGRSGWLKIHEENIDAVASSPTRSIRSAARLLRVPRSTVHKSYKILHLTWWNEYLRTQTSSLDDVLVMRQPYTFQGNWQHTMWGSGHQNTSTWLQQDNRKVDVWCGVMCNRIIGPFCFIDRSISADVYPDRLTEYMARWSATNHHLPAR